jgi:hypothetical protein
MKRITVAISDELNTLLQAERRRRDVSAAAVVRDALEAYFRTGKVRKRLSIIGIGASGYRDTARNFEEILEQEWTKDCDR